ncbi:MAG TPA: hypothetical protein VK054_05115 [Beutenbergiaceae bacterium]|nr:hypothetical protein [Beutenbergiaceae bacterium]
MACKCGGDARLEAVQGDTFQRTFTLSTWDGAEYVPTDLTDATAKLLLGRDDMMHEHNLVITDASAGEITANIPAGETEAWGIPTGPAGVTRTNTVEWRLQIRVEFSDGVVQTIVLGTLCVAREATA